MFHFFSTLFNQFVGNLFRRANINTYGVFILGILSKWYVLVMGAGVIAAFWFIHALIHIKVGNDQYLMQSMCYHVSYYLNMSTYIAKECTPKILSLYGHDGFLNCVELARGYMDVESGSICDSLRPSE